MTRTRSALELARSVAAPAIAIIVIANFAGYALLGSNGLLVWGDTKRQLAQKTAELARLDDTKAYLVHRNALLDPRKVDPDLADEMVRGQLGVVRPDEVVVPIK